ncbi:MAG TPA: YaiO family outer membrane beta-barrel protein, partial [Burkholderiaceae bacterium]
MSSILRGSPRRIFFAVVPRVLNYVLAAIGLCTTAARAAEVMLDVTESHLTQGFGDQYSQLLTASAPVGPQDSLLYLLLENKHAFGEHAVIGAASYSWDLTPLDRLSLAASGSNAPTIAPKWRADGQYSRKLLPERNLVASLGGFTSATRDGHHDSSVVGSGAWYFADRQVVEGGVRYSISNPGDQTAWRGFAAYTYGAVGQSTLLLRVDSGGEAYQSLGVSGAVADFQSHEVIVAYRYWLGPGASLVAHVADYRNPSYDKRSLG